MFNPATVTLRISLKGILPYIIKSVCIQVMCTCVEGGSGRGEGDGRGEEEVMSSMSTVTWCTCTHLNDVSLEDFRICLLLLLPSLR